ncbi:MAG TPA: pitrilysin family protein [Vicinamibacterales bacterium]|nr:pitrilysin family protein [Vicinamibacterales bacterium]
MVRRLGVVIVLAMCAFAAVFAQNLPTGVVKKASMGGITEYGFPNGLRVLLYPDQADPKITVNVTYLVGSRHEGYGETGMAHLLEHMNFIETTNGRRIKDELVSRGASWNGTTSDDRTNYYETFTASDDNLRWALGLETDRMANVKFTKEILDTEMTVVRNEFERGENSPAAILSERVASTAYLWHNYGKSTIGSKDDLEKVPVNRLAEFYKKFYQPDNAVLVITGRLDESKALQMVGASMGNLPKPARVLDQTYTVEPPQDGERFVALRRVGQGQNVLIAYHAVSAGHPDAAVLQVLAGVMNGGGRGGRGGGGSQGGRLAKALVDTKLAQSASMNFQLQHDPGLVIVSASLNQDQSLDSVRDAIYKALDDVVKNPPTREEVDRITSQLARGLENSLSNPQSIATGALNSAIAQGDWRLMFLQHDRLQDIVPTDVVRAAQTYFKPSNRTVGYYIPDLAPDRTVIASTPDLAETFKNYTSKVSVVRGESFDPTIANIDSRIVRSKLSNGMKVAVLSKKTANNIVSAAIDLRFGDATTLAGQREAASFAGALLMSGTKSHSRADIQEELRKLNAQVTVSGGGGGGGGGRGGRGGGAGGGGLSSATATISAPAENFSAALKLAVEMLREPVYPQDDFDRIKTQRAKALELAPTEPNQLASERLNRHLSPLAKTDAQYNPTREEQLLEVQKVTLSDAKKFHDDFYGANHGVLAVVGPVDPAAIQKQAAALLGNWNTSKTYKSLVIPFKKTDPINLKIETPDKANAVFMAGQRFKLSQNDPDYAAIVLASYMFGETITSRISDRIRNREGLSYGANARLTVPAEGEAAMLSGTVSLNPAVGPKVESSFMDELKKVYDAGFTAAEVDAAKKAYLESRMVGRSTDGALLALMVSHEQLGRPFTWDSDLEARIQSLTVEQINAAFRKHIDPNSVSIVKAGDFNTAGAYK